jgi:hypothetical protein
MFGNGRRRITNKDILKRRQTKTARSPRIKKQTYRRLGSFAFFLSIPVFGILTFLCVAAIFELIAYNWFNKQRLVLFLVGGIGSIAIVMNTTWPRLFILLHELKHAFVVLMTGNRLDTIHVGDDSGHVSYATYEETSHYIPFIVLAPYCFPLFSLPAIVICLFLTESSQQIAALLLGVTLGIDLATGYQELHPFQTDFKKIFGGFFVASSFIATSTMFWTSVCLLWALGGNNAFIYLGYLLLDLLTGFFQ